VTDETGYFRLADYTPRIIGFGASQISHGPRNLHLEGTSEADRLERKRSQTRRESRNCNSKINANPNSFRRGLCGAARRRN
jgi:hypothetical protein